MVSSIMKWRDLANFLSEGGVCHLLKALIKATSQRNFREGVA